jgi:hypothetical protein
VPNANSTAPASTDKPAKPHPDLPPLPRHRPLGEEGRGKTHSFGPWDDPDGSLKKYLEQKDDLQPAASRVTPPRVSP